MFYDITELKECFLFVLTLCPLHVHIELYAVSSIMRGGGGGEEGHGFDIIFLCLFPFWSSNYFLCKDL